MLYSWVMGRVYLGYGWCIVVARKSYVTIIFNFNQNIFSTSAFLSPGTDKEMTLFEEGTTERVTLKEK